MNLKQQVKNILVKAFGLVGVHAEFSLKSSMSPNDGANSSLVTIDTKRLQSYASENSKIQLYKEGLSQAHAEFSDNFFKQCRFYSMQQLVQYTLDKGLSADYIECGCWKGQSTYMIAKILRERGFSNSFHVFDSFEGLSDKQLEDVKGNESQSQEDIQKEREYFSATEEEFNNAVRDFAFITTYKGWIPDRFSEVQDRKFAFAHIDVDLYQPTRDCLEFIFPRLLLGGAIVVDDYGYSQFPGAKQAVDEFLAVNDCQLFYEMPLGSCFIIKSMQQ